jgi:hypothetical protein
MKQKNNIQHSTLNEWDLFNHTLKFMEDENTEYYEVIHRECVDKIYFTGIVRYRGKFYKVERQEFKNMLNEIMLECDAMLMDRKNKERISVYQPTNIPVEGLEFVLH